MRPYVRSQFGWLVLTLLACLSAALILSSCKKTPQQRIIGKWDVEGEQTLVEYRKDGTIVSTKDGRESTGKYKFIDDSHLELETSGRLGTNTITLRFNCEVAFHDDQADLRVTLPSNTPGGISPTKTLHYVRAK